METHERQSWASEKSLKSIQEAMKRPRAYKPKRAVRCPGCGANLKELPCLDCKING